MKLTFKNTVILVKDIQKSKDFYIQLLNQEVEYNFGKNIGFKSGLCLWELRDSLPISNMLGSERLKPQKNTKFELYFESDDLNESQKQIVDSGVTFLHQQHEEPWGQRTLRFFDPDDHLIEIGEPMHVFVKRFLDEGLTIEQVSERTYISGKIINELIKIK